MSLTMESVRFPQVKPPAPGEAIRVDVQGVPVAVFNLGGNLRAIAARCTHQGGPLERGAVSGEVVTCPWHGSQFNVDSGEVVRGPATMPEHSYHVRLEGNVLVVDLP
jgi:nitrite reductase/ring-hydroxylating ferredoxin subunit